jgi:hypothetical protein
MPGRTPENLLPAIRQMDGSLHNEHLHSWDAKAEDGRVQLDLFFIAAHQYVPTYMLPEEAISLAADLAEVARQAIGQQEAPQPEG